VFVLGVFGVGCVVIVVWDVSVISNHKFPMPNPQFIKNTIFKYIVKNMKLNNIK